ncbi:MAG: YigZ family protein [Erysipelotrichaceae bacterium]
MLRIANDYEETQTIKKSRFITYLHRCFSEQEAKDYLLTIKKMHPEATHHCYAFILGENQELQRSNDDGEPHGTAGLPILESLQLNHMCDIIAIVVRYYGGILLGTGGLVRAYSGGVSSALKNAPLVQNITMYRYQIDFSYDLIGKIDYLFKENKIVILDKLYEESVSYIFLCEDPIILEKLQEISAGSVIPNFINKEIMEVSIK